MKRNKDVPEMTHSIFIEKLLAGLSGSTSEDSKKRAEDVESRHKETILQSVISLFKEMHLHESFGMLKSDRCDCRGVIRFAFVMAYTQEDWEEKMKNLNKFQHEEAPLPTIAQVKHKLREIRKELKPDSSNLDELFDKKFSDNVKVHKVDID